MSAKCRFAYNTGCDAIATTTLIAKGDGEIVPLCEHHRNHIINRAKRIAAGEKGLTAYEDGEWRANHWLVKNKIPS